MSDKYSEIVDKAKEGKRVRIDLEKKKVLINNKCLNLDGELLLDEFMQHDVLDILKVLYHNYKVSVPNRETQSRKSYFKAKYITDLTDEEMICQEPRYIAQVKLELYVLFCGLLHLIQIKDGYWFWQDTDDRDLVILKKWL